VVVVVSLVAVAVAVAVDFVVVENNHKEN